VNEAEAKPDAPSAEAQSESTAAQEPAASAESEEPRAESAEPSAESALRGELEKAQADASKYKDQLLRTAADFDNFRKRARKDVEEAQRKGQERALLEMLPVSDNLERAIQAAGSATDVASITEGVRMVLKLLEDGFGRLGVERVASVGQPFDPSLHEAVQQVESDSAPGTVVHEMVPGYRLGGKLLRAAMVAVARPKAQPPASGASGEGADGAGGASSPAPSAAD
jgi:molecular chaperone GrpE